MTSEACVIARIKTLLSSKWPGYPAFNRPMQGSIPARSNFSVWCSLVARVPRAHEVEGSNPSTLTFENSFAWVAQLAVQRAVNPPAKGSVWKLPARRGAADEGEHARRDDEAYW